MEMSICVFSETKQIAKKKGQKQKDTITRAKWKVLSILIF